MNIPTRQRGFNPDNQYCSIWGAIGGAIGGALIGKSASDKASRRSKDAARYGIDEQRRQFNATRQDLSPWVESGQNALTRYETGIGDQTPMYGKFQGGQPLPTYQNQAGAVPQYTPSTGMYDQFQGGNRFNFNLQEDPIYQYQRDQALQASTRGANAMGGSVSGGLLNELARVGAGEAGKYQQAAFGRQLAADTENYGRDIGEYGLNVARNQDAYGRGIQDYNLGLGANRETYNRGISDYGIGFDRNQAEYNRGLQEYGLGTSRNQDIYGRQQNYLNRLADLSGSGQNAAAQLGSLGAQSSANIGNLAMQNANNQGNIGLGAANIMNSALQSGMSNYLLQDYLSPASSAYGGNPYRSIVPGPHS